GDIKIDSLYAQKLAHALHLRGVTVMHFSAETTAQDLEVFLRLVGPASTRPLSEELTAAGVVNINLQHVDYSGVQMTSDLGEPPPRPALWDEILRALVAGRSFGGGKSLAGDVHSVAELAALIIQAIEDDRPAAEPDPDATYAL